MGAFLSDLIHGRTDAVPKKCSVSLPGGFSAVECVLLLEVLQHGTEHYFEWGAGSSTRLAATRARVVTSIEGSKQWTAKMKNSSLPKNVHLRYVNIGPTEMFSWPVEWNITRARRYIRAIDSVPPQNVILVDGRWRVACAMRARRRLSPRGVVLVHDFTRPEYQILRSAFHVVKIRGTLAALRPRNSIDNFSASYERVPN